MPCPRGLLSLSVLFQFFTLVLSIKFTNKDWNVTFGEPFTLKFDDFDSDGAQIDLLQQDANGFTYNGQRLVSSTKGDEAIINISTQFPDGTYRFRISEPRTGSYGESPSFELRGSNGIPPDTTTTTPPVESPPLPEESTEPPGDFTSTLEEPIGSTKAQTTETTPTGGVAFNETTRGQEPALPSTGLSTGAKAGIGIGAGLGALSLIGFAAWLLYRRRRLRAKNTTPSSDAGEETPDESRDSIHKQGLAGQQVSELGTGWTHELEGSREQPREMEGDKEQPREVEDSSPPAYTEDEKKHDSKTSYTHDIVRERREGRAELP